MPDDMAVADLAERRPHDLAAPDLLSPDLAPSGKTLWAKALVARTNDVQTIDEVVDNSGNIVVVSRFVGSGPIDLGGGPLPSSDGDMYIVKYDPSGRHLWSRRFGAAGASIQPVAAAVDGSGNLAVSGLYEGPADFGGGPLPSTSMAGDAFLIKYDASGKHLWSKHYGGDRYEYFLSLGFGAGGEIIASGLFENTVDFGSGPLTSAGAEDIVLAKFTANGDTLWARRFGGSDSDLARLLVSPSGDLVLGGYFSTTADLGGGPVTSRGHQDMFLAKYTPAGSLAWSRQFGGIDFDFINRLAVDGKGNIVVSGQYIGAGDVGGAPLPTGPEATGFLAKYTPNGDHLWSGRLEKAGRLFIHGLAVDRTDQIVLSGAFSKSVDVGGGPLNSAGDDDIAVAQFSADGAHVWSQRYGAAGREQAFDLALDGANNIVATGVFEGMVDFGTGPLSAGISAYSFVLKLRP